MTKVQFARLWAYNLLSVKYYQLSSEERSWYDAIFSRWQSLGCPYCFKECHFIAREALGLPPLKKY